ncbi:MULTISPECIES: hypothetical protein [unclassified Streptomyces]|uniref:hypothetical protein n=1 Tax=unclassified Streptomyces TaxID=2593676 RepID=UPI001F04198E|nr:MULTISPECIES: hypothetical protein [unclassified Streptomyces]MCH0566466.1 hypothetical protein [Streptomyces sp. MUM 2J]MCH0571884.1 hypothetical protein [Streptomyces sp. MUM 136J]
MTVQHMIEQFTVENLGDLNEDSTGTFPHGPGAVASAGLTMAAVAVVISVSVGTAVAAAYG